MVRDSHNLDSGLRLSIDDVVRELLKDIAAGTSLEPGPDPRCRHYDGDSPVDLGNECLCGLRTSLKVPVERIRQFPGFASGK